MNELVRRILAKEVGFALLRLYLRDGGDAETMRRAVAVEALPEIWREHFLQQLAKGAA